VNSYFIQRSLRRQRYVHVILQFVALPCPAADKMLLK